jgi:hypothetical protein
MANSSPESQTPKPRDPVHVDFALQGVGAHGAFAWGVLDRLLEEPWLRIAGLSGTSAVTPRCAERFLEQHTEDLGQRPTLDLDYLLEGV